MRRIFTFSFITIAFLGAYLNSFGQTCTQTTENFNTATTTQGFTGTRTSGTGTFTALALSNNELRSTVTASGLNTYAITSPTFSTPTLADPINFTFDYNNGPQATVTSVQYAIRYVNTSNVIVETAPVNYVSGTCVSVTRPIDMIGNNYQIVAIYTVTAGNGAVNSFIAYDNFGTNGTAATSILPVKFSALDARMSNNTVSLKWTVGTEDNVSGYEIEKSTDGRSFSKIGFVNAAGQSSYTFVDAKPSPISYYRIKSVDANGKYAYSTVTLVKGGKSMIVLKAFFPNANSLSIQHATATGGSLINISAEDGRLIKAVAPVAGTQQTEVNLSTAKPGLYVIRFSNGDGLVETLKILKQQ